MSMSRSEKIFADSTFYICFLDDISDPQYLLKFIEKFDFLLTPIVKEEIKKSENYRFIKECKHISDLESVHNVGKILEPFFGTDEIKKGEHEVIGVAYIFYEMKMKFYFILDESGPRAFVERNFNYLCHFMIGTVKFVGMCYREFGIIPKSDALMLLRKIEKSRFRVTKDILTEVREYIEVS